jgi:ferritin-like metal-binding protein YciE
MCPNLEEYGLLSEFPRNLFEVYFYQRRDKVLTKLAELIKVPDLHKILEKSGTCLKWKMIEEVFERRKNDSRFVKKRGQNICFRSIQVGIISKPHWNN